MLSEILLEPKSAKSSQVCRGSGVGSVFQRSGVCDTQEMASEFWATPPLFAPGQEHDTELYDAELRLSTQGLGRGGMKWPFRPGPQGFMIKLGNWAYGQRGGLS